jgi:hypothetical protein
MRRVEQNVPRPLNINPMAAMKGGENKRTMKKKKPLHLHLNIRRHHLNQL